MPVVGSGFGALFDAQQMNQVVEIADLFYHKRFILEKEECVARILEHAGQEVISPESDVPEVVVWNEEEQSQDNSSIGE